VVNVRPCIILKKLPTVLATTNGIYQKEVIFSLVRVLFFTLFFFAIEVYVGVKKGMILI